MLSVIRSFLCRASHAFKAGGDTTGIYASMDDEGPAERILMIYRIDEDRLKQVYLIRTQATVIIQFNHYLGG